MKSPCRYPGCAALLDKSGFCSNHKSSAGQPGRDYDQGRRKTDPALAMAKRIRSSARWQRVQRHHLSAYPMCSDPFGDHAHRNTTASATQVHHIQSLATHPELAFHADNLQSACAPCHSQLERVARSEADDPQSQPRASGSDYTPFG